jgi:fructose-1,6-bisphosphatase/inositol monophosphatase family enzyme
VDVAAVSAAIRHAHAETVAPKFRSLLIGDIDEKSPGEVVTVADRACEQLLGPLLRDIVDAPVVGEEQASSSPDLIDLVDAAPSCWLLDPIDGTANFAAGSPEYAVMVGFVERGRVTASWIFQPEFEVMAVAALGAGATRNGRPVRCQEPASEVSSWRPVIKDRFLPPAVEETVGVASAAMGPRYDGGNCAGIEYPALVGGEHTLLLYWRTLPWDHGPCVLYATEAGCEARRPNGERYSVGVPGDGLVVGHQAIMATAHALFFGAETPADGNDDV